MSEGARRKDPEARRTGTGDPGLDLALRCRAGDEAAWTELYLAHGRRVSRFLRRILGDTPDLEDLVQQVFLALLTGLEAYRGEARFGTWVLGIASHVAEGHLRRQFRWRRRQVAWQQWADAAGDRSPDPGEGVEAREILAATFRAVADMDLPHRTVWVMCEVEGLDGREVAVALGIPAGTVRSRLFRARRDVATALCRGPGRTA